MTDLSCFCQIRTQQQKIGVFRWYFGDSWDLFCSMIVNDMQGLDSASKIMKIIIPKLRKNNMFSTVCLVSDPFLKLRKNAGIRLEIYTCRREKLLVFHCQACTNFDNYEQTLRVTISTYM